MKDLHDARREGDENFNENEWLANYNEQFPDIIVPDPPVYEFDADYDGVTSKEQEPEEGEEEQHHEEGGQGEGQVGEGEEEYGEEEYEYEDEDA